MNNTQTLDKIDIACQNYKIAHASSNVKFDKLDEWLEKESDIFVQEINPMVKHYKIYSRGQIVKVDFGINIGSEICYTHLAIVITKNDNMFSDALTLVPITSKNGNNRVNLGNILHNVYPNSKKYNLNCYANLTQIKSISKKRILVNNKNYVCDDATLDLLDNSLIAMYTNQV